MILERVLDKLVDRISQAVLAELRPALNGGARTPSADRLLTVGDLEARLGVKRKWIYAHAPNWSFTRRLDDRTLRFSERGLEAWLKDRACGTTSMMGSSAIQKSKGAA